MNKKIPKKLAILPIVLVAGLVAFVLLTTAPSSGPDLTLETTTLVTVLPPRVDITLVAASPGGLKTEYTRINFVDLSTSAKPDPIIRFTDTGQTKTAEVGAVLQRVSVMVYIAKIYAVDRTQAANYTRVTVTIKDPTNNIIFNSVLVTSVAISEYSNYWAVNFYTPLADQIAHALVPGQYTVTAKYEIYA